MKKKQTLVLLISRKNTNLNLLPYLKVIIPMLELLGRVEVYTTSCGILSKPIYQNLVKQFQNQRPVNPLEELIQDILLNKVSSKYRICVVGDQEVSWKVVLQCKRKGVVVDVAGKNAYLSFWTGGIQRIVDEKNIISAFILDFGINTELRKIVNTTVSKNIQFNLNCKCCDKKVNEAYLCSVCLNVYCLETKRKIKKDKCLKCDSSFDQLI